MLFSVEDLPALLSRAASRQESRNAESTLLKEFADEVLQSTGGQLIRLIEITPTASRLIYAAVGQSSSQQVRLIESMALPDSVIREIQSDRRMLLTKVADPDGRRYAVAGVAERIVLLVEFLGGAGGTALYDGIAEICADLYRRESLTELRLAADRRQQTDAFVASLYACRDEVSLSNILATDGAALLGCRRISVCQRSVSELWKLVAATSVNQPNPRADAVRKICQMIVEREQSESGSAGASPFSNAAPRLIASSDTGSLQYWISPLSPNGEWRSSEFAVVFEWDAGQIPDRTSLAVIRMHAAQALQVIRTTTGSIWTTATRMLMGSRRIRSGILVGGLSLALAILVFWPMELTIEANGVLEPSQRKYLWATDDGIVTEVPVVDGQEVDASTELIRIRNEELQLQLETILGDLATSRARLSAIEAERVGRESSRNPELLSEHAEVNARIESLEEQSRLLEQRIQSLIIVSPLKGRLFGASLKERFLGRPVVRGQYFGEVADLSEAWEIRIQVKEADVRHLLSAVKADGRDQVYPEVTFSLATQPEVFSTVRITQISPTTKLDSYGNLTTEVTARLVELPAGVDRPGTGVLGRIHCGKRSLGYVCFRRMIDYVGRTLFM